MAVINLQTKTKMTGKILLGLISTMLSGCTLPMMLGLVEFSDFDRTYEFNFSKNKLKDKIVDQYSYDIGLLSKNLGRTLIESPGINIKYRISITEWLDKENWDEYRTEIRQSITDTTDILIVKQHSRKSIQVRLIIDGDERTSKLRVINVTARRRREFREPPDYYKYKITKKLEKKFIEKLN
jgi:hypothetical protein